MLLQVHLDDEGNDEDEEGGAGDPRGEEAVGDIASVGGGSLSLGQDRRLGDGGGPSLVSLVAQKLCFYIFQLNFMSKCSSI